MPITEKSHCFAHSVSHGILQSSPVNSESTLSSWECSSETHSEDAKSDEEESENDECEKVKTISVLIQNLHCPAFVLTQNFVKQGIDRRKWNK